MELGSYPDPYYLCSMLEYKNELIDELVEKLNLQQISIEPALVQSAQDIASFKDLKLFIERFTHMHTPASNLAEELEEEVDILVHKLKFIPTETRPKVLLLENIDPASPLQSALTTESIRIAGGVPLEIQEYKDADILLIKQDEFLLYGQLPQFIQQEEWSSIPAIKNNKIYIIKKDDFANVPGKDYLLELEILAEIIQPKYFIFGHQGIDWVNFDLG